MNLIFSIIIPAFNSEKSILHCLDSLLLQTYSDFEVLVIDNESTDNTLLLLKRYQDERVKVFSEKDKSIYDGMNKGIALAKGKWLMFLGSDDALYDRNVLTDVHHAIGANDADVLYGNVEINGETGWGNHKQVYDKEFTLSKLLVKNIAHQAIFYHRKVFEKIGDYNLRYKICADYDFNLRVAAHYKMFYLDRIIATFTAGGTSTNQKDIPFENDFYTNIFKYFRKMLFRDEFARFSRNILQESKRAFKKLDVVNGSYFLAVGIYLTLFRSGNK